MSILYWVVVTEKNIVIFFFKKKIQEKEEKNKSHGDLCYVTILDNVFVKTEKELKDVGSRDK